MDTLEKAWLTLHDWPFCDIFRIRNTDLKFQIKADNQDGSTIVEKKETLCSSCSNRYETLGEENLPGKKNIRSLAHINE